MNLFPVPRKIKLSDQFADLSGAEWIVIDPALCGRINRQARALAEELASVLPRRPQVTCGAQARGGVLVDVQLRATAPSEVLQA